MEAVGRDTTHLLVRYRWPLFMVAACIGVPALTLFIEQLYWKGLGPVSRMLEVSLLAPGKVDLNVALHLVVVECALCFLSLWAFCENPAPHEDRLELAAVCIVSVLGVLNVPAVLLGWLMTTFAR
ncbi:MAG: hypothetical protein HY815_03270 [Candidatus Riflebacteria bacterium]|nr:hypothetical protein [Candidatus Riflebacteria bacterium]